jgi:L-asparaginase
MTIRILVTGGTFDKEYNEISGELFFKDSHLPELLQLGRCRVKTEVRTLMLIDSLEMTDADRQIILAHCQRSKEGRIIITHGTDTMAETAKLLGENIQDKTIVLTGAMIPFTFGSSDGLFNLGCAVGLVQALPHGVYVSMNGRVFNWDNVRKNRAIGDFEQIHD